MKNHVFPTCVMIMAVAVAAGCGTTPQDRAISGAGIGAGAGAIIGAVTGLSVLEAAALGGVAGGLTGALTNRSSVDLGEPAWKSGGAQSRGTPQYGGGSEPSNLNRLVYDVQSRLAAKGYAPGPIDGVVGPQTREAIRQYQRDHGMPADGQLTPDLVTQLNS